MVTCLVGCATAFASLPIGATDAVNSSPAAADTACRAYPFVLSTAFILIFSPLLAKTARIATIFGEKSLQTRVLTDAMLSVAIVMLLVGNWAINFIWLGVDPMEAVEVRARRVTDMMRAFPNGICLCMRALVSLSCCVL